MQECVYSKDRSRAYCVRSSEHLAMASTVEAEEAKVCPSESCDRKPVKICRCRCHRVYGPAQFSVRRTVFP